MRFKDYLTEAVPKRGEWIETKDYKLVKIIRVNTKEKWLDFFDPIRGVLRVDFPRKPLGTGPDGKKAWQ